MSFKQYVTLVFYVVVLLGHSALAISGPTPNEDGSVPYRISPETLVALGINHCELMWNSHPDASRRERYSIPREQYPREHEGYEKMLEEHAELASILANENSSFYSVASTDNVLDVKMQEKIREHERRKKGDSKAPDFLAYYPYDLTKKIYWYDISSVKVKAHKYSSQVLVKLDVSLLFNFGAWKSPLYDVKFSAEPKEAFLLSVTRPMAFLVYFDSKSIRCFSERHRRGTGYNGGARDLKWTLKVRPYRWEILDENGKIFKSWQSE